MEMKNLSYRTKVFVAGRPYSRLAAIVKQCLIIALLSTSPSMAMAQGGKGQGGASSAAAQSAPSGGGNLPGLSWAQQSWKAEILSPPDLPKIRLICFKLVYTYSASQPFVLERITERGHPLRYYENPVREAECSTLDEKNPLLMRERLVIGIENTLADLTRIRLFNLNLTNQQGNAINPTPIRPSFAGGAPSGGQTNLAIPRGPYFLAWPDRLPGDVIPTISVNVIYTPPMPGQMWSQNTFYPELPKVQLLSTNGMQQVQ